MKTLTLLVLSLTLPAAVARAELGQNLCQQPDQLAKVESAVVADVRQTFAALEPGAGAASFHFSPILRYSGTSDLTVYFERVQGPAGNTRRGFSAQYRVDGETCAPTFRKMQPLYTDQEDSRPLQTASPAPERCNDDAVLPVLHAEIANYLKREFGPIHQGATIGNFSYSSVWRAEGASDMVVFFEASKPGIITTPMIAKVAVDPVSCKPDVRIATAFTWMVITYP